MEQKKRSFFPLQPVLPISAYKPHISCYFVAFSPFFRLAGPTLHPPPVSPCPPRSVSPRAEPYLIKQKCQGNNLQNILARIYVLYSNRYLGAASRRPRRQIRAFYCLAAISSGGGEITMRGLYRHKVSSL